VGQRVYAIGAPKGLELTMSDGIISSLRELDSGRYIQTTAPISPGSSGGGLFDEEGRLIGLPTLYLDKGQQLNFALPVEWVKDLPGRHSVQAKGGQNETDWMNQAIALEEKEDWPRLLEHAQRWTKTQPKNADAWYGLGVAYANAGQANKAIEAYQQALRIDPEDAQAWFNLGSDYDNAGQATKAIEAYQQALRIDPEYAKAWNSLGIAYVKTGQSAKAIETYQQALRVNPEHAKAWIKAIKAIEAYPSDFMNLLITIHNTMFWLGAGVLILSLWKKAATPSGLLLMLFALVYGTLAFVGAGVSVYAEWAGNAWWFVLVLPFVLPVGLVLALANSNWGLAGMIVLNLLFFFIAEGRAKRLEAIAHKVRS
jgi:tetratricopeptide (TPR) repeat protein